MIFIVLMGVYANLNSGYLNSLRAGTNTTEIEYKTALYMDDWIPDNARVLILTKGSSWFSIYAHVIPYNPTKDYLLPGKESVALNDSYYRTLDIGKNYEDIERGCIECIDYDSIDFVIINQSEYDIDLNLRKLVEYNNFVLYEVDAS